MLRDTMKRGDKVKNFGSVPAAQTGRTHTAITLVCQTSSTLQAVWMSLGGYLQV